VCILQPNLLTTTAALQVLLVSYKSTTCVQCSSTTGCTPYTRYVYKVPSIKMLQVWATKHVLYACARRYFSFSRELQVQNINHNDKIRHQWLYLV